MTTNNYSGFNNFDLFAEEKLKEKKKIKITANIIGAAYIVLWLFPSFFNRVISDIAKIFGSQSSLVNLFGDPAFLMVIQTLLSILMFTLPFFIIPIAMGKKVRCLANFEKPKKGTLLPFILLGVGASAFANIATNTIAAFFSGFGINFLSPDITYPTGVFGFIISFIAVAITPALVEEFAIRGMVMGSLREYGQDIAILMSSFVFAIMHGNLVQIPFAFIMGLVIGFAVVKSGSIWTGIAIHFANNGASVILNFITDNIASSILQNTITVVYFALCFLCLFVGLHIIKSENFVIEKGNSKLRLGEKIKYFVFSPCIIVSIGLSVIDCIGYIQIG